MIMIRRRQRTPWRFLWLVGLVCLTHTPSVDAQVVATPASKLGWDTPGQTAAVALTATYNQYIDAAVAGVTTTGLTCTGAVAPASCTGNLTAAAMVVGNHTLTLTEVLGLESAKSVSLAFEFRMAVQPTNLRIVKLFTFWRGGVWTSSGRRGLRRIQIKDFRRVR